MAAGAWKFWTESKVRLSGTSASAINLATGPFRMLLFDVTASATIATTTITIQSEIAVGSSEVSGGRYVAGGITLSGVTWASSGANAKWDFTDPIWTASGSAMSNVKYAIIVRSVTALTSGFLLCYSTLSTAEFDVTVGNTLTVQLAAAGAFTLS